MMEAEGRMRNDTLKGMVVSVRTGKNQYDNVTTAPVTFVGIFMKISLFFPCSHAKYQARSCTVQIWFLVSVSGFRFIEFLLCPSLAYQSIPPRWGASSFTTGVRTILNLDPIFFFFKGGSVS